MTSDLQRRVIEHNKGRNVSTANGIPWKIIYYEAYGSKKDATKREIQLKKYSSAYGFLKKRIADSINEVKKNGERRTGE